jgi:hypothetical protein
MLLRGAERPGEIAARTTRVSGRRDQPGALWGATAAAGTAGVQGQMKGRGGSVVMAGPPPQPPLETR